MVVSNRNLWFFGTKTTEVWYNSGAASFPFQPIEGVFIQHGIASPYSAQDLDNTIYFVGRDTQGTGLVWRFNGYTPERISTYAVDHYLQALPTLQDVIGLSLQLNGHAFYGLYSPHADSTLMFDIGEKQWTEWAHWDEINLRFVPWVGRCQASGFNKNFIGSREVGAKSGTIYYLDPDVYTDEIVLGNV